MEERHAGEGRLSLLAAAALTAALVTVAVKLAPPKLAHGTLHDRAIEECRFASMRERTADVIRDNLWQTAREQGLDAYFDVADIDVQKTSSDVRIRIDYARPVALPGYTYVWRFHLDVRRPIYTP